MVRSTGIDTDRVCEPIRVDNDARIDRVVRADRTPGQEAGVGLLTVRAAAERLGVGYSTLKRWVHAGTLRTVRTEGGHHRVAEAEVERLLARRNPAPRRV